MQPVQFSFYFAVVAICSHRLPIFCNTIQVVCHVIDEQGSVCLLFHIEDYLQSLLQRGFAKSRPAAQRPAAHGPRRPSGLAARRPIGPRPTTRDGPAARWPSPDFPVFLSSGKSTRIQWTTVSLNSFTI